MSNTCGGTFQQSIDCSAQPLDLSFHPNREYVMAAALADGTIEIHDLRSNDQTEKDDNNNNNNDDDDDENDTIMASIDVHTLKVGDQKASCRAVHFSTMGDTIYTGGTLGDFCALDAERACTFSASDTCVLWRHKTDEQESGVQVLHQLPMCAPTGPLLVTGHEDGAIRLWDSRLCGSNNGNHKKSCVMSWDDHEDYISGFDHHVDGTTLLASSADCTLSVMDLRKTIHPQQRKEAFRQSDNQEDELLSVQVLKNGRKVVCGTQQGVLAVWSWGTWGDVSDRFPGHPASIDALLKVDEDTLLTGSSDGLVRLVQIHPDKLLGVLGDHDGFPIEKLQFNSSRKVVGSISHDNFIRLWDTQMLLEDDEDDDEGEGEEEIEAGKPMGTPSAAAQAGGQNSDDDWSDGDNDNDEDEIDSDDSGDEKEVEESANDRRSKKLKTDNERFFEDL